jgi:hypothetical protein
MVGPATTEARWRLWVKLEDSGSATSETWQEAKVVEKALREERSWNEPQREQHADC